VRSASKSLWGNLIRAVWLRKLLAAASMPGNALQLVRCGRRVQYVFTLRPHLNAAGSRQGINIAGTSKRGRSMRYIVRAVRIRGTGYVFVQCNQSAMQYEALLETC
jgi:hypothetical protein